MQPSNRRIRVHRLGVIPVAAPAQTLQQEVTEHEGSSVREAHLREVQDHPPQGQDHGDLRESQAQAEAGLIRGDTLAGPISVMPRGVTPLPVISGFGHFFRFGGFLVSAQAAAPPVMLS